MFSFVKKAKAKAESWGEGGSTRRKVDTAVAVVGAILAGKTTAQTAVAAISPELNAQIHEITKDSKLANILAHATLSATEFYAAGLDPMAGALAGAAGEGSAMLLAEKVFNKKPADLTAGEKELLKVASQLAGAVVGGISGDSLATATEGAETAKRAVENNYLSTTNWKEYEENIKSCNHNSDCIEQVREKFTEINKQNSINLKLACQLGGSSKECAEHTASAKSGFEYAKENIQFDHTSWMSGMMRTGNKEAKQKPTDALLGSELLPRLEKFLSSAEVREKLKNDPNFRKEVANLVDISASSVRTELGNAYEFGAQFEYPNIGAVEKLVGGYKVFGKERPLEPVYPEAYIYGGFAAMKGGKTLYDLASTSTKWTVGVNGVVSAASQYLTEGEINLKTTAKDMGEAYITKDFGFKKFVGWNVGTGFIEGYLNEKSLEEGVNNALNKSVITSIGYGAGKTSERFLDKRLNTFGKSLEIEPIYPGSFIFKYKEPNSLPTGIGNLSDSVIGRYLEYKKDEKDMLNKDGK